jgi:hypothetical protein
MEFAFSCRMFVLFFGCRVSVGGSSMLYDVSCQLSSVGCRVLKVDCRGSLSMFVVWSRLSGVGCQALAVDCRT